jgi:hypothetical protein
MVTNVGSKKMFHTGVSDGFGEALYDQTKSQISLDLQSLKPNAELPTIRA